MTLLHRRDDVVKLTCALGRRRPASSLVFKKILEKLFRLRQQPKRADDTSNISTADLFINSDESRERVTDADAARAHRQEAHRCVSLCASLSDVSWWTQVKHGYQPTTAGLTEERYVCFQVKLFIL